MVPSIRRPYKYVSPQTIISNLSYYLQGQQIQIEDAISWFNLGIDELNINMETNLPHIIKEAKLNEDDDLILYTQPYTPLPGTYLSKFMINWMLFQYYIPQGYSQPGLQSARADYTTALHAINSKMDIIDAKYQDNTPAYNPNWVQNLDEDWNA